MVRMIKKESHHKAMSSHNANAIPHKLDPHLRRTHAAMRAPLPHNFADNSQIDVMSRWVYMHTLQSRD